LHFGEKKRRGEGGGVRGFSQLKAGRPFACAGNVERTEKAWGKFGPKKHKRKKKRNEPTTFLDRGKEFKPALGDGEPRGGSGGL